MRRTEKAMRGGTSSEGISGWVAKSLNLKGDGAEGRLSSLPVSGCPLTIAPVYMMVQALKTLTLGHEKYSKQIQLYIILMHRSTWLSQL